MQANIDEVVESIQSTQDIKQKALLMKELYEEQHVPIKSIAEKLGFSSSYVCNFLRITKLPDATFDGFYAGIISMTHLFVLARLESESEYLEVYELILSKNMSTTDLEAEVRRRLYNVRTTGNRIEQETKDQIKGFFKKMHPDADVSIVQTRVKGKIIVELKGNLAETSRFLEDIARKD